MKGLPDRVENINTTSSPEAMALVWEWLTPLANISFCVSIYNFTGGGNVSGACDVVNTEVLAEQCMINDTQFSFTPLVPAGRDSGDLQCSEYEFVIRAVNHFGRGPASSRVRANFTYTGMVSNSQRKRLW